MTVGRDKLARRANHFGFPEIVSSPRIKNISVFMDPKSAAHLWPSRPTQRASAVVTDVGRVAVDADVTETNVADAYGEVGWAWRPDAGVKLCGFIRKRWWQESPFTRESTV